VSIGLPQRNNGHTIDGTDSPVDVEFIWVDENFSTGMQILAIFLVIFSQIDFRWLDEALGLALVNELLRVVPLIGNLAQNQLKGDFVTKCMKVLKPAVK
jgi:hypothetical protein